MQRFKKYKRKLAWLGVAGTTLSGIWWIGVFVGQAWQLVHRFV